MLYRGGDFMEDRIVKLKGLELENFKNVKYGKIDFKEDKDPGNDCRETYGFRGRIQCM